MDESSAGDVGVATALGRICALEAKLRQAIQHTHLLSSSFESEPAAADREREALLAIRFVMLLNSSIAEWKQVTASMQLRVTLLCREQLELLEDKLRDFRCLRDNQYDDKVLNTLHQQSTAALKLIQRGNACYPADSSTKSAGQSAKRADSLCQRQA